MKNYLLNINGVKSLDKKTQKEIKGGRGVSSNQYFDCHCGFAGGSGESHAYVFPAASINDALSHIAGICGGQGGTCHGLG